MTAPIGKWNPAWGPEPTWRGPAEAPRSKPRYRVRRFTCPQGCLAEPVTVYAPVTDTYACAACGTALVRVLRERRPAPVVEVGDRFGRLVVEDVVRDTRARAVVRCDCGVVKMVEARHLRDGRTRSCGCLHREIMVNHPWRRRQG